MPAEDLLDSEARKIVLEQSKMKVVASQFPVTADIGRNAQFIRRHVEIAASQGADAILFPEGALSGYGRSKISFEDYDWAQLRSASHGVVDAARKWNIWVFLGSAHFLSRTENPTNCLYIISPTGDIVDRYDKSMLIGHELDRYSAGSQPVILNLKGWRCGFAICYDSNYPEIFNRYRHMGVRILFLAMNGSGCEEITPHVKLLSVLTLAQYRIRATDNQMWIVVANSSTIHSTAPSMICRPDGSVRSIRRNRSGLLYHRFPDDRLGTLYNGKMMKLPEDEVYHSGNGSFHQRALDRRSLP